MKSPSSLTDPDALIVADASTAINLNASGCVGEILQALPNRLVIVEAVHGELEAGRQKSGADDFPFGELFASGLVKMVELCDVSAQRFTKLVVGGAASTVDDGEAATIAYAVQHSAVALIDERKAIRISRKLYPQLRLGCTVDVFAHPEVQHSLGRTRLEESLLNALRVARMRVLPHHLNWVVGVIGPEQAATCASLPRSVRFRTE